MPEVYIIHGHVLSCLALLSGHKNYRAQYFDFDRKKKIYSERNKNVSFDLTKAIIDLPHWTVEEISRRHDQLKDLAQLTWTIE